MFSTQRKFNTFERSRLNSSIFFHVATALLVAAQFLRDSQESAFDFGEPRRPSPHPQPKQPDKQEGRESKGRGVNGKEQPSVFKLVKDVVVCGSCYSNLSLLPEWYQANYQHNSADRLAKACHSNRTSQDQTIGFDTVFHHYFLLVSQHITLFSHSHLVPSVQDTSWIKSKLLAHWEEVSWHSRQKSHPPKRSLPLSSTASYGICYDMRATHFFSLTLFLLHINCSTPCSSFYLRPVHSSLSAYLKFWKYHYFFPLQWGKQQITKLSHGI